MSEKYVSARYFCSSSHRFEDSRTRALLSNNWRHNAYLNLFGSLHTMKNNHARLTFFALAISLLGVAIHVAAMIGGPPWYAFFGAPPQVVASAQAGTWLAPVSTAGIAILMGICAVYASSALGLVRRLPLLRTMLAGIAAVCLLRALVLAPIAFIHPQLINVFEVVAALTWGTAGIGFLAAFLRTKRALAASAA